MRKRSSLEEADKKYLWHPFTQMKEWLGETPLVIERGQGSFLYDIRGKKYLDGVSSLWVTLHGHRKREIDAAVRAQLSKISHSTLLGLSNVPSIELARRLVSVAPPGLSRVFYSDNGSTAVEVALKMAFQYWQHKGRNKRTRFICLREAYHGDTIGSVSLGGIDLFHSLYRPLLFDTIKAPSPYCYRCELGLTHPACGLSCAEVMERIIRNNADRTAAVVVEPCVQAAAGMIVHPPGYLRAVREACTRHGVFLAADEVATGFGRTGRMFACGHEGVSPDLMALAKGLTGGYLPAAATLTTETVFTGFHGTYAEKKTFFHGHTYTGNPLACAAGIASLDIFERENVLAGLQPKIAHLTERLDSVRGLAHVGDVRQAGLMVGIELVKNARTREPYPYSRKMGFRVCLEARKYGVIIRPLGDVIVLMPPLSISRKELDLLVDAAYAAVESITEGEPRGVKMYKVKN